MKEITDRMIVAMIVEGTIVKIVVMIMDGMEGTIEEKVVDEEVGREHPQDQTEQTFRMIIQEFDCKEHMTTTQVMVLAPLVAVVVLI